MAVETLYRERRSSVNVIDKKLHIAKSTLYDYLQYRGVKVGKDMSATAAPMMSRLAPDHLSSPRC